MIHDDIPVGAVITHLYYTVPNNVGVVCTKYATRIAASLAALESWGANTTEGSIRTPEIEQRVTLDFPQGGGTDVALGREFVSRPDTEPAPTKAATRRAIADRAAAHLRQLHDKYAKAAHTA